MADQVRAMAARVLARIEADGRWQAGGDRTFGQWVARRQGASVGAARREAALGRALDESLPATARAVAGGHVSLEHAEVLARHAVSSEARKRALASTDPRMNEAHLARQAARQGADEFRKTVQRWAHAVDASTAELEHEAACDREYLTMTRRPDGVALQGLLTHEHGEAVAVALRAVAGVPAADDARSREQRQATALVDAARLVLDRGLAGAGQTVRPHLSVTVSWESLQRQVRRAAETDGDSADPAGSPTTGSPTTTSRGSRTHPPSWRTAPRCRRASWPAWPATARSAASCSAPRATCWTSGGLRGPTPASSAVR